jgi:probable phosphoglycerate mutase
VNAIILVRHGRTAWNAEGRFVSRTDLALDKEGRIGVLRRRAAFAQRPDHVWCSPARRARETAELLFPQNVACIAEALREVDFGTWEGKTGAEVAAADPDGWARRKAAPATYVPPGGESFAAAAARLAPVVDDLRGCGGLRVVVAHRTLLGVLERMLRGLALDDRSVEPLEPASWREISER